MTDRFATAETLVLVAVGGFAGANLRWVLGDALPGLGGTLLANATGAFALGFLLYEAMGTDLLARETRVVLGTGFLSSYTTYSTFAVQSALAGSPVLVVGNVLATYALGFVGVVAGRAVARALEPDRGPASEGAL